ncbi:Inositol monophosphatase 2 [Echinococcus granulosus]|uniref:Inositol monophosphatase 2 n=1 Tax=Echinococcus granulosus TaxID=6210 RepID=W6UME8_ECHGR|nr:Inositol monophosphatase 2 [Echinococcus granulosus]EUB62710.1 Inositol monophosphatase 2 [Echinococcus granulosus]
MLDFAKNIAKEAGSVISTPFFYSKKLIASAFDQPPHYHEKVSFADLVTDTDKQVEDLVMSRILETYPDHKIIAEESASELHNALILTDWGGDRNASNLDTKAANIRRLISEARGVRTMGSAALHMCQVAAGQGDVFFEFGIHCWDYAAASLIVTEAGGYCCNVDGEYGKRTRSTKHLTSPHNYPLHMGGSWLCLYVGGPVDLMARHCVAASSKQLAEMICQKIVPISYPRD